MYNTVAKKIGVFVLVFLPCSLLTASVQDALDGLERLSEKLVSLQDAVVDVQEKLQEMTVVINDIQAAESPKEPVYSQEGLHTTSPIMQYAPSNGWLSVIVPAWRCGRLFEDPKSYVSAIRKIASPRMQALIDTNNYRSRILEQYIDFTDPRCTREMLDGYSKFFASDSKYWAQFIKDWLAAREDESMTTAPANFAEKEQHALHGLNTLIEGCMYSDPTFLGDLVHRILEVSHRYGGYEWLPTYYTSIEQTEYSRYDELLGLPGRRSGKKSSPSEAELPLFQELSNSPNTIGYEMALARIKDSNDISERFTNKNWSVIAAIVQSVGYGLLTDPASSAKKDFLQNIMPLLNLRRQSFPVVLVLLKCGYYEPSFIRFAAGSILWSIGEKNSRDEYPFNPVLRACLHELLKFIQQCPTSTDPIDLSGNPAGDDVLTGIARECFRYRNEWFEHDGRDLSLRFKVLGCDSLVKYDGASAQQDEFQFEITSGAFASLEYAIQFRKQFIRAQEERAAFEGAQALARLERERREDGARRALELDAWQNEQAAQALADQKVLAEINKEENLKIANNNVGKKAHAWSAVYVDSLIDDWNGESGHNICTRCGGEWNLAEVLRVFCETPEAMWDQLKKMERLLVSVVLKILMSDVTLQGIQHFSLMQKMAELLAGVRDTNLIVYLKNMPKNFKQGDINLLKVYIDAVGDIKNQHDKPALPESLNLEVRESDADVKKELLGAIKKLYPQ